MKKDSFLIKFISVYQSGTWEPWNLNSLPYGQTHLNLDGGDSLCLIWIANGAGCKDVGVNYGINKEWITNYYIYSIYMMLDYKYI